MSTKENQPEDWSVLDHFVGKEAVAESVDSPRQNELLPCPFCGQQAEYHQETPSAWIQVFCSCGCPVEGRTKEVAAAGWNRRVAPSVIGGNDEQSAPQVTPKDSAPPASFLPGQAEAEWTWHRHPVIRDMGHIRCRGVNVAERLLFDDAGTNLIDAHNASLREKTEQQKTEREALQELLDNALIQRGNDEDRLICYDRKTFITRLQQALGELEQQKEQDSGLKEPLSESVKASRQITLTLQTFPDAEGYWLLIRDRKPHLYSKLVWVRRFGDDWRQHEKGGRWWDCKEGTWFQLPLDQLSHIVLSSHATESDSGSGNPKTLPISGLPKAGE